MSFTTRGHRGGDHVVITPANRYRSRIAHLPEAEAFKLVSPRLQPAAFAQTLLRVSGDPVVSERWPDDPQHFVYVLAGETTWQLDREMSNLGPGGFFYAPPGIPVRLAAAHDAEILHIARRRVSDARLAPALLVGHRADRHGEPAGVPGLERTELLPASDPAFDFAIAIMSFEPHAALGQVEIHDEEHGLYMLSGDGRYLLGDSALDVRAGDFIYMAPYCPQSFVAGDGGASYLLYKDAWRESM